MTLEAYKEKYKAPVPTLKYSWDGTSGWKEVVMRGGKWTVVDFTAEK
jgi:hypothetical protein